MPFFGDRPTDSQLWARELLALMACSSSSSSAAKFLFFFLQVQLLFLLFLLTECSHLQLNQHGSDTSSPFPPNFLFGTASSAYQYEGGYLADGKGFNTWDVFTHDSPGSIVDGSNGDVAVDQYHRYQEHIDLMASLGINSYQFSISWARILPRGIYGEVNSAGIDYYNKLIDALLLKGIQPFIVLNHFDIPIELENRYGSWLSPKLVEDFKFLADICFKNFGDRVKYWVTFSEPNMMVDLGYLMGISPPNRCSKPFGNCAQGDSEKEPFVAAHNIILAHAAAAKLYKTKYQKEQGGSIGFIVETAWFEPMSNSIADKLAAERAQSFLSNWFLDPIIFGRYPKEMQDILGSLLPKFSRNDVEDLKLGSVDFIGINHYTSSYVKDCLNSSCGATDSILKITGYIISSFLKNGIPIGEPTGMEPPFYVYPLGMERIVTYMKERYNNTPMFITENGYCELSNSNSTSEDSVNDVKRIEFFKNYLHSLMIAMRKGADVRGYFLWTLLDGFEWSNGYTVRYGIHHVDHSTLKITPKQSAAWYKNFITEHKKIKASFPEENPQLSQY